MSPAISFASSRTRAARGDDLVAEPPSSDPPVAWTPRRGNDPRRRLLRACGERPGGAAPQHA
jgi:hypothetical protein